MSYILKIKKNKLTLLLSSENKELIAQEFGKFAAAFVNIDNAIAVLPTNIEDIKLEEDIIHVENIIEEQNAHILVEKCIEEATNDVNLAIKQKLPVNFAKVLAAKTQETTSNVVEKKVSELKNAYLQMQNILKEKNIKSEVDYVVAAAYCLSHYENRISFSEEQIKAKITPFCEEELEHDYILEALDKNLIKVLPDFTGLSDNIEFELTQYGEEYFLNEL